MDRLQNIETFVRVAQTQSFAEAARQLRVAKSVVTTRIKQLEDYLGGPLFHRSTRVVRLSELGQAFLRDCTDLVGRANDMVDQMRDVRGKPAGTLRIHALTGFVLGHFGALLREFQPRYPDIRLELMVSDSVVDPVQAGVDCALQIFPAASSELISRPLFPVRRVFCATPHYLAAHPEPQDPRDLPPPQLGLYSGYPTRAPHTTPSWACPRAIPRPTAGPSPATAASSPPTSPLRCSRTACTCCANTRWSTPASCACPRWWPATTSATAPSRWCCLPTSCRRSGSARSMPAPRAMRSS